MMVPFRRFQNNLPCVRQWNIAYICSAMFGFIKRFLRRHRQNPLSCEVFDLTFDNPIGVLDSHDHFCTHANALADDGFSFVEIGPITIEPQHDIIPNKGAQAISEHLRRRQHSHRSCLIVNICKNPSTDIESALHDYEASATLMWDYADIICVNVAEEHVPGACQLQDISYLSEIVDKLIELRLFFNDYKPIIIQISNDLPQSDLDNIIHYSRSSGVDGLVSGNIDTIRYIFEKTRGRLPVIAKADFPSASLAIEYLKAGAVLIEAPNPVRGASIRRILRKKGVSEK